MSKASDDSPETGAMTGIQKRQPTEADIRRARVAQKLRENLARRKHQNRARRSGEADETDGLPAAKSTQADD
ncbi:hypothetical protein [Rhizobium halophytocola]|uniref:DUF4169 family protein n=1 Tax=Rhizobium halophytocola TaxID=735519 RepID=A0ABS4E572_9HYPH|nr:hypothetical protein [Rhizobium halophytocola]MBP1853072.1 hypothetical protein [Rhizobium halophytocola]